MDVTAIRDLMNLGGAAKIGASLGAIDGVSTIHKFGRCREVETADPAAEIWSGRSALSANRAYTYPSSAETLYISSSDNGDTVDIEVQGLDANYIEQTQTVTLVGQTKTEIGSGLTWIRTFRAKNVGSTTLAGTVYIYADDTIAAGVPDTATKIRAIIENGDNQTVMAIYTVPAGKTALMLAFHGGADKGPVGNASAGVIGIYARPFGQVFQNKANMPLPNTGGITEHPFAIEAADKFTEKTDIKMVIESVGVNDTDVTGEFVLLLVDN